MRLRLELETMLQLCVKQLSSPCVCVALVRAEACIDQTDISANLAALPIFLSGCKELVVLAGETWHTRLWCCIEVFTFLKMGGTRERIRIYELGGFDARAALQRFDAAKARCALSRDRQRLLAVVEAGFGDVHPFNEQVRSVFGGNEQTKTFTKALSGMAKKNSRSGLELARV